MVKLKRVYIEERCQKATETKIFQAAKSILGLCFSFIGNLCLVVGLQSAKIFKFGTKIFS